MPAVLIYVPGGKINKLAYEGAMQQVEALRKAMGENTETLSMIDIDPSNGEAATEEDRKRAERFVQLACSGKPVIALIPARGYEEAYFRLAKAVSPDAQLLHPSQLAIINALRRPETDEEWQRSLSWTVARVLMTFENAKAHTNNIEPTPVEQGKA
ncbi:hypothetical protein [Effusibacillus pohliae]|uniref:hypothetical protein n=1 Tax=Effusibacillus pohliae TaxID=232270 RepID=UPI00037411FD|nr:hypothetical protein [Effusibacillus pohliae]